jgi:hypothetical protein
MRTERPRIEQLLPIWREMAEHLLSSPRWAARQERGCREVWQDIFLYGTSFTCMGDECFAPLVEGLRDLFELHLKALGPDAHDHSALAGFLASKAGERLLVNAFAWLAPAWERASPYFWETAAERAQIPALLEHAWKKHFSALRQNTEALSAFKILALQLASQQVPIAIEVQNRINLGEQSD